MMVAEKQTVASRPATQTQEEATMYSIAFRGVMINGPACVIIGLICRVSSENLARSPRTLGWPRSTSTYYRTYIM